MRKIYDIKLSKQIDHETGEILNEFKEHSFKTTEPSFIKMYLDDILSLTNINSTAKNVLFGLLKYMDYENRIDLASRQRKELAQILNTSIQTISNSLGVLIKKNILLKLDRGSYLMNPDYFAKGKWSDILKIKISIEYTPEGRILITQFENNKQIKNK